MAWDQVFFEALLPFLLQLALGVFILLVGHKWGRFAARQVLDSGQSKWKAYALALLPSATVWVVFAVQPNLRGLAGTVFWTMSSTAVVAACAQYNQDGFFGRMLLKDN
ncbi:MAG: hypothetical protein Q8N47_16295 [Bryobacterales bacterium]|nr:hypothetical protein [Bryobacterales bacterium]